MKVDGHLRTLPRHLPRGNTPQSSELVRCWTGTWAEGRKNVTQPYCMEKEEAVHSSIRVPAGCQDLG